MRRRIHEGELTERCTEALFAMQLLAADDYRADATLNRYCHEDAALYCTDVEPLEGRVQECLVRDMGCS